MTSPKNTIATMVRNKIQSVRNLAIICLQLLYQALKLAATVLEIFKLVEAGAGRREEHGVARFRTFVYLGHRGFEVSAAQQWDATIQLRSDFIRRGTDQQRRMRFR